MIGASEDDLKLLIAKNFIIPFDTGIVVIKHWKIHNYIRNDRYKQTVYAEEKGLLELKENGSYTLCGQCGNDVDTIGIPSGYQVDTQVRLGKVSIGKDRLGEDSIGEKNADKPPRPRFTPPTVEEVCNYCYERNNNVDPERFVDYYTSNGWVVGKNKMKDWKAAVRTWEKRETATTQQQKNKPQQPKRTGNVFLDMLEDEM